MKYPILAVLCLTAAGALFGASAFDKAPQAISTRIPILSPSQARTDGYVQLLVDVNAHGYVTRSQLKSESSPGLSKPCMEAIVQWRFTPAMKDGVAVPATIIQPFRFGENVVSTEEPVSSRPKISNQVTPELPENIKHVTGAATVAIHLNAEGLATEIAIQSATHDELRELCLDAVKQWKFTPAIKDGKAVPATIYAPFHFAGIPMSKEELAKTAVVENRDLKPIHQSFPTLPPDMEKLSGKAEVQFLVDAKGYVSSAEIKNATDPKLGEIAKEAVLTWKFRPVIRNGVAVAAKVTQPFVFGEGVVSTEVVDKLPAVAKSVEPELPDSLRGVAGTVKVLFIIDANGKVLKAEARESSLDELVSPVLQAANQWTFKPAIKAGQPVDSKVLISFVLAGK